MTRPGLEIERSTADARKFRDGEPRGGLVVTPDNFMTVHRAPIISAAARNNVPAVYFQSPFARDGGLLSYGTDQVDIFRRAASWHPLAALRNSRF